MEKPNYTISFLVSRNTDETYASINSVRGWWSGEIVGETDKLGSEFIYTVTGVHRSTQKIIQLEPGKKIVWLVTDAELNFVQDKAEWKGTEIIFEIQKSDVGSEVKFTHKGLNTTQECYSDCSNAWGMLIGKNLKNFIITGKAQPSPW
ncbi:SRPBCC domain-containing protein [Leptospira sp. 96542]|nr:SRPBCC domain-containing protein [Leptospira sp. 96542]